MHKNILKIGIVGATGAVGRTLLELFVTHEVNTYIVCYASNKSAGKILSVKGKEFEIVSFSLEHAASCDVLFLCVSGSFSLKYGRTLAQSSYVIDNSSAFRYHEDVPLIVPPVNAHFFKGQKFIANPNCSSAIALVVLSPLHQKYKIEHIVISTYQAASGAGQQAIEEIKKVSKEFKDYDTSNYHGCFSHNLAFNAIPKVDNFQDNFYTKEEMKMVWEIRKVLEEPNLPIDATAVRIPTLRSHAESISLKFCRPVDSLNEIRTLLKQSPSVELCDDIENNVYPMPSTSTYKHDVEVGRIRYSLVYGTYGINLFISGDQLLRGAALNAYEIYRLVSDLNHS